MSEGVLSKNQSLLDLVSARYPEIRKLMAIEPEGTLRDRSAIFAAKGEVAVDVESTTSASDDETAASTSSSPSAIFAAKGEVAVDVESTTSASDDETAASTSSSPSSPPSPPKNAEAVEDAFCAPRSVPRAMVDQVTTWDEGGNLVMPQCPVLPVNDPRDRHLSENISVADRRAVAAMRARAAELRAKRFAFVKGEEMRPILQMLGASDADLEALQTFNDNLNDDPHLPFRKSAMYRLGMDQRRGLAHRLQRQPFVLSAKEGFKRKDSGLLRFFGEPQMWMMQNTAWQALIRFKSLMMRSAGDTKCRDGCDPEGMWNHCGFFLRTTTTKQLLGEPAAEGIHQDGVEFTMTVMFNSQNMSPASAHSTIWSLDQEIGLREAEGSSANRIARVQHSHFLDTLMIVDNEVSHSVSAVYQADEQGPAVRDMGVFFTRRMAMRGGGFSAEPFDTEEQHEKLPFAMSLRSPFLAHAE